LIGEILPLRGSDSSGIQTERWSEACGGSVVLIWGSIGCVLATKFGGEVGAHEISNT